MAAPTGATTIPPEIEKITGIPGRPSILGGKVDEKKDGGIESQVAETSTGLGETTTGDTTSEGSTTTGRGKKKGKKGGKRKSSKSKSSKKGKKKGKKKKDKKKKTKKQKLDDTEKPSEITDTGPKYTEDDIASYRDKKAKHKARVREQRLINRMKDLISIIRSNDPRWNPWTEEPLIKFIQEPNVEVVTIFFERIEEKKIEKKLMWAEVEDETKHKKDKDDHSNNRKMSEFPKKNESHIHVEPLVVVEPITISETTEVNIDPFKRYDKELENDKPLGPPPIFKGIEKLIVINEVQANNSPDFFYFVKVKSVKLNNEIFFEDCIFGNIPGGYLGSLQSLLSYIYTPIFYEKGVLPDSVKNDFSACLNKFMSAITETHHRLQNQTMLYVPKEVLNMPVDVASRDKELVSRLEDTMIHWIRQIKGVLSDQSILESEDWTGPLDEILFWETRCVDLAGLTTQIRSQQVRMVRDIMQIIKSPYVTQFNAVAAEILEGSAEAISNLYYLNVLREPCQKIHESKMKDVPDQLQNILWLIRIIWLNAPFYNTRQKLNGLVRKVSNELIMKCMSVIDVERVFNGYIDSSEAILQDCLTCLTVWKKKYFEAQKMHSMNSNTAWLLEYDKIFTHVDAFIQRIRDLLEICVCQRLYARRVEGYQEELPLYPGTRAPDITRVMIEVQKMFDRQLRNLYNYTHLILEVKNATWHEHMIEFRTAIKDMEMMVQNVLMSTFDSLSNIESCCQLLETFYYYRFYQRDIIARAYDKLTVKLYKLFENDTIHVKNIYAKNVLPLPLVYPHFAGRGAWALYMKQRVDLNYECLHKAWWLPECGLGEDVVAQYKVLSTTLGDFANQMYDAWVKDLGIKDLTTRLAIPLMCRSTYRPGMIEVNFDKIIHRHITEAEIWARSGREIPSVLIPVYLQNERLHNLRETVLLVVKDYNRIVAALSAEERSLFKERIKLLDRKINPGMHRLTWLSDVSDSYINDCRMAANKVQGFTNDYKNANIKIGKLATKISSHLMVRVDPTRVFDKLEFNNFQTKHREKAILRIAAEYKDVTLILRSVYEMFRGDGAEVKVQWIKYLETIDEVVKEAMCINIRRSLEILRRAVAGGELRGPPPPIFKMDVVLNKTRLEFNPTIAVVKDMLLGIYGKICYIMRSFPRVIHFLMDPNVDIPTFSQVMATDEEAQSTQQKIAEGVNNCVIQVKKYREVWDMYRDVWEVNKDIFMEKYEKLNPTVLAFDSDIGRYAEVANIVQAQESILTIVFCILDCTVVKDSISEHCRSWQERLCSLLYEIASNKIMTFHHYMTDNLKKFVKPPETIPEMVIVFKRFRIVVAEIPGKEKEFPGMFERFACLKKHEYELGDYTKSRVANFNLDWHHYQQKLKDTELMLKAAKERLRKIFIAMAEKFRMKVSELVKHFDELGPYTGNVTSDDAVDQLGNYRSTMEELKLEELDLFTSLAVFDIDIPPNMQLKNFEKDLAVLESVWEVVYEWDYNWEEYKTEPFKTMQTGDMEDVAGHIHKKLVKLSIDLEKKNWPIIEFTKNRLEIFKRSIPVIHEIKNHALRERHWQHIFEAIGATFDPQDENFTFEVIVSYGIEKYADEIIEIVSTAQKELVVENTLRTIREIWIDQKLDMVTYKDKGHFRLKSVQDIMQNLEDHNVSISAMKGSRFAKPFEEELIYWEKTLVLINDVLEIFLNVQRQYIYLENIFMGEDIRKQLPKETKQFDEINDCWKEITQNMAADSYAIAATHREGLIPLLKDLSERLEIILKSLEIFLEAKRQSFPRFYFISNDDLLEILGNSRNPEMVQPHLKKLFDNIHKIKLTKLPYTTKYQCEGMISGDSEYIEFIKPFTVEGPVEFWLREVENNMRTSLKQQLIKTRADLRKNLNRRDKWIKDWPGQTGITSAQMQWTTTVTRALYLAEMHHVKNPLKKVRNKLNKILNKYSVAIRGSLLKLQRLKVVAMVTIEIHNRDVVDKMYKLNCRDMNTFEWLQQLRFYWEKDIMDCMARQTNTFFVYGYEYLGNSGRLVVTPLTDRCYVTLTTALFLHRGGSPKGPAGTGKTETTKDLGKNLGVFVIVVNCSEGLDYKSMGKMFSGLSQAGLWICFDEFNRINIEVLSVVAQQIMCILQALSNNQKRFFFEGYDIPLIWSCGIFITMNPGYAGRTELPDNLKAMFRPISMIVPDTNLIAEIVLFGEGFRDTRVLARKVDTLYSLAKQQLSKQDHYDFGLRSMVALLRYAGQKRRQSQTMTDAEVLILAMRDMNIPRLTTDDVPLFSGVIRDLFPNDEPPQFDYGILLKTIKDQLVVNGYQPTPKAILKCLELYNTKNSRHSVMIVGRTGSGKSVTWKTLRDSLTYLAKEGEPGFVAVKEHIVNPKALDLAELYGEFDLSTNEWADGVISAIMRITCVDERPDQKWILFDGPVDAVWIENMNSVMDDNKILTLINSERISMPEQVSLLFEVDNLTVASPATVSRCGMVYNDYRDLGWKSYIESWLGRQKKLKTAQEYRKNIDAYLEITLQFKANNCKEIVAATELNLVIALTRLMDSLATKENGCNPKDDNTYDIMVRYYFMFSLIWSVCCTVNEDGRKKIDSFLRETDPIFPAKDTIYDYFVDPKVRNLVHWDTMLSANWKYDEEMPFFKIVVPTVDTVRYNYVLSNLLKNSHPVCVIGPVGTGKTSVVQSALQSLDPEMYAVLTINMSSQTTSSNVQNFIESRLERRAKGVFAPAGGKSLLTFMDDLNMPAKDIYGSQPPLELVRQWLDYKFWYDRQTQTAKLISNMFLVAAMGPPGGGRTVISPRLQNIFSIINMTFPEEAQIKRIFCSMLVQKLTLFDPEVKAIAEPITMACIDLFNSVSVKMLPTPNKIHYLFNLRDISRVYQGLLRANKKYQDTKISYTKLWYHECARVFHDRLVDDTDREWLLTCLAEKLGTHLDQTLQSICPNRAIPVFGDFMNTSRIYEDLKDPKAVRRFMTESALPAYNSMPGCVPMNLVLFKDAIEHIARIARVVSQPKGNMLVVGIGGHGRQSLSRLATYICEFMIFEIEVNKRYRKPEFREDIKKVYRRTGCDNKSCCFIMNDTQIVDESFLEDINNILSSGEVPNLYKPDEFEDVKSTVLKAALRAGYSDTNESIFKFVLDRVQSNLHVILCMSPIGDSFRHRVRQYPALVNCTTIDWFDRWPKEALLEVAHRWLSDVVLDDRSVFLQDEMRTNCATMFSTIHFSVTDYCKIMLDEMKRHNYVTPINYLELVRGYKLLLHEKRKEIGEAASRLRNGLFKIIETRANVEEMQIDLEISQRRVAEYQEICDSFLEQIVKQKTETDIQAVIVAQKRERVGVEEKECKEMARVAYLELEAALPALNEAMEALAALNKKDLSEVKSYANPPKLVATVMEAVMVLKGVNPTWAEAKKQLGAADFLKELQEFDKDNISEKTLKKLEKYINDPGFIPKVIGKISKASESLCIWVRAMELYGKIYNAQVAPKKAKLDEAEAQLKEKQRILAEAEAKIRELEAILDNLKKQHEEKLAEKDALAKKAEDLMRKLQRAAMLVDGLAGEKVRWEETIKLLGEKMGYVVGDCLLAAACLSYIGPFLSNYRDEMVYNWIKDVRILNIPCAPEYSFCEFLSYPTTVRLWNIQGLPRDSFSTENGVIVTRGTRTPLMIDPQCQALKWIKNMENSHGLRVIDLRQSNYLAILEESIVAGTPVLLKDVGEELDHTLAPVLSRALIKQGTKWIMKLGDKELEFNHNFRFYITTKLSNPHYIPEIASRACIVNFAVKEQGLEAQLLGIVVRREKPELEEMKNTLVVNIAAGKKKLEELEDTILRLLNESKGSILDDEELAITLKTSKETSIAVTKQVEVAQETEIEIDAARENYRLSATRASILFFVLYDMSQIDPMYQFSLDAYISLFNISIEKSPKSVKLDDRIQNLNEYHTYSVYRNICRALFEKHKLLFSLHMCVKIMDNAGKLNMEEYQYFLKGGVVLDRSEQMDNPCEQWLSEVAWDNITELDKLPGFRGIVTSFEQHAKEWNVWYTSTEPEKGFLPGEWELRLIDFQKMIVVRALRPDRVSFRAVAFVANNLGTKFTEPPVLDMHLVLDDSTSLSPLIFVLSSGADPAASLFALAEHHKMMYRFFSLSLGQGQAPFATRMILEGAKMGHWVFLANCHLSLSWMPQLDKLVETIQDEIPHKDFRLWLSSSPHPDFPLSILQAGIKMTTEPPKGIKANMKRLYQGISDTRFTNQLKPDKFKKLLFALCFFHAILLERKKFQQLGWNIIYGFNDSDFEVSELLLGIYLGEYDDTPWDALKYLIAGVMYGGHVTDDWDRRLLGSYMNQYFCEDAIQTPFYKLSELPNYYIPKDGDIKYYREVVNKLPSTDHPEAFGQHTNADIASQINEANLLFTTLLSLQVQKQAEQTEGKAEDTVALMAAEVMAKLPEVINEVDLKRVMGESVHNPMNIVLLQEISRYNVLLYAIRKSLIELDKGIQGLVVMSTELEDIFKCIFDGRVPNQWLKAYPSMKSLGAWSRDLSQRVEQLALWASTLKPPVKFWLSGFTFPSGFLTAVLQTAARKHNISIDTLSWEFSVSAIDAINILLPPKDGVYIQGLFLEGASWDKKTSVLCESAPMQLVTPMPVIHFKPVENRKKSQKNLYDAPCYYYPNRAGGQGRPSYIVTVELRGGSETPDHWTQRGVALLMSLAT